MKYDDRILVWLCIVAVFLMLLTTFNVIIPVGSDETVSPFIYDVSESVNYFGNNIAKRINRTFFINWIRDNFYWKLQQSDGFGWYDCNNLMDIDKNYNYSTDSYKINLNFTSDNIGSDGFNDYRFVFYTNISNMDFVKFDNHTLNINYSFNSDETYYLKFDYSDILEINGIITGKGVKDNLSYWYCIKRDVADNKFYSLDPIFGLDTKYGTTTNIKDYQTGMQIYTDDTNASGGTIDNITVCIKCMKVTNHIGKAMIYDNDDNLIATSDETTIPYAVGGGWVTFDFSSTVYYESDSYYNITCFADSTSPAVDMFYATGGDYTMVVEHDDYTDGVEDPFTGTMYTSRNVSIYASYTENASSGCTDEALVSNPSIANGTTGVEDCRAFLNYTVDVNSSCGSDVDYINISIDGTYNNHTGVNNGTYWVNRSGDLSCNTNYKVYVNASVENGADVNNSWFDFTTEACCDLTIEGYSPANGTDPYDYNLSYVNASAYFNSSCDNTIDWINISLSTGDYNNQSSVSEGLHYYNFTGLSLTCNTNYTVYYNSSDGDGCNNDTENHWTWFMTGNCDVFSDTCPTSSNPDPANKSTNVALDVGYWNITITDLDGNNTNGSIFCSSGDSVWWDNQANGTRSLTLSTLTCETNYTVWVNFTSETNASCIVNETYWFVTVDCPFSDTCPTSSGESPANKSTDVALDVGFWNITISDLDGNNTNGSIFCSNGDSVWWDNQANGTRSLTLSALSYSTNYTVWVNFTSETNASCIVNETYWFVTVAQGQCILSLSNENISNKTTGVDVDLGYYNFSVSFNSSTGNYTNAYVNISFGNMSRNVSVNANGSSWLNYSYNFTCGENNTWYVNFTNDCGNNLQETYWFTTDSCPSGGGCDCDDIRTIVREELETYNALKESDNVEISLGVNLIGLILFLFCFFVGLKYRDYGYVLMAFATVLAFSLGFYYVLLEAESTTVTYWLGVVYFLFSIFCGFLALYLGLNFGRNKA